MSVGAGWLIVPVGSLLCVSAEPGRLAEIVVGAALAAFSLVLATIVARRAPGHPASAVLAAGGVALTATIAPGDVSSGPFAGDWMLLYLPFAFLLLLVPDGRFLTRRWRTVGLVLAGVVVVFMALTVALWAIGDRSPVASAVVSVAAVALLPVFFALLAASVVSLVARYRGADERQRLQLRWVFAAGVSLPMTLVLCWTSYLLIGSVDLVVFGLLAMYLLIPAGVTVAIVRPGWFDIDRAAVAALSATALSVLVLALLSVACAVTGLTLLAWSPTLAIVATIVLTLLAVPLYGVAQRAFGRWLYPQRVRAIEALRRLRPRVDRGEAEPEAVQAVLRASLHDRDLVIAFPRPVDGALLDLTGAVVAATPLTGEVRLRGQVIGAIVPGSAAVSRPSRAVADAAAPFLDAVRLRADLKHAMAEVAASRERIVRAGYEERRRLERDLHDGAQQRLVALGMRLRVLQRSTRGGTELVESLDGAVAELGTALAELRQIAHGVRPSTLDDGLASALAGLARLAPAMIELDVHGGEVPDAVGTTAYFVVSEAVVNALRHAEASRIRVQVGRWGELLRVAVADDGVGGAAIRPTGGVSGLSGLEDRVAALGGRLRVVSTPGSGTVVEAVLPCGS